MKATNTQCFRGARRWGTPLAVLRSVALISVLGSFSMSCLVTEQVRFEERRGPLTVTRVWRADHEPSPWDASLLEPLILRDEQVTRREARGRIEETRRYRAYVFRLNDVQVPEILFASRPRAGGVHSFP